MDLFTLVGKIAIDSAEAETKINTLLEKAGQLNTALGGTGGTSGTGSTSSTGASTSTGTTSTGTTSTGNATGASKGNSSFWDYANTALTVGSAGAWKLLNLINSEGTEMIATMEDAAASYSTKLGITYEEGMAFAEKMREFAKETPLGLSSVLTSADQLLSTGISMEDVIPMLTVIGNNINGEDSKMYRATKFVTDVMGYGQINAQERRQGIENGIYIDRLLEDYFFGGRNVTGEALKAGIDKLEEEMPEYFDPVEYPDMQFWDSSSDVINFLNAQHAFDFNDMWNALVYAQEHGSFVNAMANKMGTYSGVSEKYGDAFSQYAEAIVGETGLGSLKKGLMEWLTKLMESETERLDESGLFYLKDLPGQIQEVLNLFGSDSFTDEEWEEELRQRQEDAGQLSPEALEGISGFQTTIDNWTSTFNVEDLKNAIATAAKEGVSEGLSGVTITTGNVTLNDGALVGRLTPKINLALGQIAVRDMRG